ncbi:MAG: AI-2E family transporter [Gammaproteobacteria bacterium]
MTAPGQQNPATQGLFLAAAFVVVIAGMKAASAIVVPFLIAVFVAVLASSPLFWLRARGVPMWLALPLIVVAIIGVMVLLTALLGASLDGFSARLPLYQARLRDIVIEGLRYAGQHGVEVSVERVRDAFDPSRAIGVANRILSALTNLLGNAFMILFTIAFILLEAATLPDKLRRVTGHDTLAAQRAILEGVRRYIGVKFVVSAATGACIGLLALVMKIDFPFLWAILGFLLNFVPTIGSMIAAVPACLVALVQFGLGPALVTGLGYFAINVTFGNIVEPRWMGRTMGLSTLVVFLSLVFWGWVLGPIGMLLSVPLTMVVKIVLEQNPRTRAIAIVLGSEKETLEVVRAADGAAGSAD